MSFPRIGDSLHQADAGVNVNSSRLEHKWRHVASVQGTHYRDAECRRAAQSTLRFEAATWRGPAPVLAQRFRRNACGSRDLGTVGRLRGVGRHVLQWTPAWHLLREQSRHRHGGSAAHGMLQLPGGQAAGEPRNAQHNVIAVHWLAPRRKRPGSRGLTTAGLHND